MTRKACTFLLYPLATFGLGCADTSVTPLQQAAQPQKAPPIVAKAPAATDPELANAPTGDTIDSRGDTMAAEAVRQYLADLDSSKRQPGRAAPRSDAPAGRPQPVISQLQAAPLSAQRTEHTPAAAPPRTEPTAQPQPATAVAAAPVTSRIAPIEPLPQANAPVAVDSAPAETARTNPNDGRPQVMAVSLVGNTEPTSETGETSANSPRNTGAAATSQATLDQLIAEANAAVEQNPTDARAQWRKSLLLLATGRTAEAGAITGELTDQQRGLLARQVAVNAAVEAALAGSSEQAGQAYAATEALRDALRQDAELVLPALTLCSKVTTFGVYSELPDSALIPYRANRAIVYCEVRNLATEGDATKGFRSLLATRMELFAENGVSVWTHEEKRIEDASRCRREDFFIAQLVTFPATLAPGKYTLKASVTDLIGNKTNETTREIRIGAAASAAPSLIPGAVKAAVKAALIDANTNGVRPSEPGSTAPVKP